MSEIKAVSRPEYWSDEGQRRALRTLDHQQCVQVPGRVQGHSEVLVHEAFEGKSIVHFNKGASHLSDEARQSIIDTVNKELTPGEYLVELNYNAHQSEPGFTWDAMAWIRIRDLRTWFHAATCEDTHSDFTPELGKVAPDSFMDSLRDDAAWDCIDDLEVANIYQRKGALSSAWNYLLYDKAPDGPSPVKLTVHVANDDALLKSEYKEEFTVDQRLSRLGALVANTARDVLYQEVKPGSYDAHVSCDWVSSEHARWPFCRTLSIELSDPAASSAVVGGCQVYGGFELNESLGSSDRVLMVINGSNRGDKGDYLDYDKIAEDMAEAVYECAEDMNIAPPYALSQSSPSSPATMPVVKMQGQEIVEMEVEGLRDSFAGREDMILLIHGVETYLKGHLPPGEYGFYIDGGLRNSWLEIGIYADGLIASCKVEDAWWWKGTEGLLEDCLSDMEFVS